MSVSKAQIKWVRSLQQKKYRDELGLFVAEGDKCVEELQKGFELVALFREGENATGTEIKQMSGLQTPQGTIGVFKMKDRGEAAQRQKTAAEPLKDKRPQPEVAQSRKTKDDLILVLDGVQNPGNLGTIIRTCDWFGVHEIICSRDTADVYNPKVVQATMGALVRVRVTYREKLTEWLEELRRTNDELRIYGTLLEGKNMYEVLRDKVQCTKDEVQCTKEEGGCTNVIVMGNEGNGISEEVRKWITHPIRIPSYPKDAETSESLNVSIATAIVLAEFRKLKGEN